MKKFFLITAVILPLGVFAQGPNTLPLEDPFIVIGYDPSKPPSGPNGLNPALDLMQQVNFTNPRGQQASSGSFLGSGAEKEIPDKTSRCKDCDEVKKAISAAKGSSGAHSRRRTSGIKKWSRRFSYDVDMKIKKMFARKYKAKTTYSVCFNW